MKKIDKKFLDDLLFNMVEVLLIILIGKLFGLPIVYTSMLILVFLISRACFGDVFHFKTWYRCLVWSIVILLSLFLILKIDLTLSILFTIYAAFIMTGKANIQDAFLWKNNGEPSKYQDIIEYVKYNEFDDKLLEFERKLKAKGNLEYALYKYKFKDDKTFDEMSELLDNMKNPRIVEYLDKIAFALRMYCGI